MPIPPLVVVLPIVPIVVVTTGVVAAVLGMVAWLARRTYGRMTLGERRAGEIGDASTWRAQADHVDG